MFLYDPHAILKSYASIARPYGARPKLHIWSGQLVKFDDPTQEEAKNRANTLEFRERGI